MTTGNSAATRAARCAGWRAIDYSVDGKNEPEKHGDTLTTIKQIRAHNSVGAKKRCWK